MGDEFIKNKSKSYKHQAEKIHAEEFNQPGVFTAIPDRTTYVFRFTAPGVEPEPGDQIWVANVPGKDAVRVMQGTTTIGEVDAAGSKKLRAFMADNPSAGGVLPAIVTSGKQLDGFAKAKVNL